MVEGGSGRLGDARRERRVVTDLPASVAPRHAGAGRVLDISLVGCLLRTPFALDAGEVLDLRVDLPDGPLRVKARVAESSVDGTSPPGASASLAGLAFLGLAAADEVRLRAFLESESRRSPGADKASS